MAAPRATFRVLSTGFGLMMAAATAIQAGGPALAFAASAGVAVLVGAVIRPVATVAVLLAATGLVFSGASPLCAVLAGLSAAGYLILRYTVPTTASVVGAIGFAGVGLIAAVLPFQVAWLPVVAPLAVFAIYVLVTRPYLGLDL